MSSNTASAAPGPARDYIGYGRHAPKVRWPGGAKLAINLVLIYEEGSELNFTVDGRNDSWGEYGLPSIESGRDLGTETHFEFGARAGIWRLTRLADRYAIPVTISGTAMALKMNPELVEWIKARGHDLMGHGLRWTEYWDMPREEERRQLRDAVALYRDLFGSGPLGWNCRSRPSVNTRDLLAEQGGFLYDSDPCNDELPYFVETSAGPLLVVPYSKTFNDSRYLVAPGYSNPGDFTRDCCSAIDYLAEEAAEIGGRMMTIAVHARWTGQPNRASGLRDVIAHALGRGDVTFMRRADIANFWIENHAAFRPAH
jgi:peptidoglycan/xylan/chitin deacetylase (PgdA/CDA1 family)